MTHPKILKEEKLKILEAVFKGRVSDELTGFMTIIIKKDRFKGIGVAYVTTPFVLDEMKKAAVKERLLATTSYRKMEIHYNVDEGLIGGMVIRIGDRVVDSSVRTKLEELKRQLLKARL